MSAVAVVTGAGRGLGAAIAARLQDDGFTVVGVDRHFEEGAAAHRVCVELGSTEAADAVVDQVGAEFGAIDVLVNDAMWIEYAPLDEVSPASAERMIAIGLLTPLWLARAAHSRLTASTTGAIVNIASAAAFVGVPNAAVYAAVKGGIVSLTRQLAVELAPDGIRVNAVAPGFVPTPGALSIVDDEGIKRRAERTPLGRTAVPDDIAAAVSYLASAQSSFITGQTLVVDGGTTVSL